MAFYKKKLYDPRSSEPFRLSRSKIDLFVQCPRCYYLDVRKGISRPEFPAFTLNSAVDALLKKEFDIHRKQKTAHPLMDAYGIDAIPLSHEKINEWRANFKGITYFDDFTNFIVTGAIDDIWQKDNGEIIVVDYKATSKGEVSIKGEWQKGYKRQMEIYQWLFRQNGFKVSDTGYFVYCNGKRDREAFDGKLEFDITLIPYTGSDKWVPETLQKIKECLNADEIPNSSRECEYCGYVDAVKDVMK